MQTGRKVVKPLLMRPVICVQEYLEFAKKGGELGRTAGVAYNFRFFLYRQDGSDAEPAEQNGTFLRPGCQHQLRNTL